MKQFGALSASSAVTKATVHAVGADLSMSKQIVEKPPDPDKAALKRSAIRAAQMIQVPSMTQVLLMVRSFVAWTRPHVTEACDLYHQSPSAYKWYILGLCTSQSSPTSPTCLGRYQSIWFLPTPREAQRCSSISMLPWLCTPQSPPDMLSNMFRMLPSSPH